MVQTRNQLRNKKSVTFSENEFNQLNNNISILNVKHNDMKQKLTSIDTKVNHIVSEVCNIQKNQKNGYSFNQLYLVLILIGILMLYFNYNSIYEQMITIIDILENNVSYHYDDFSMYHTYLFNSTFSEDWFDKLVSHPKIGDLDLDFYINVIEKDVL
jgi:tetrahydromethanopterin S-methyltransferase subunit G